MLRGGLLSADMGGKRKSGAARFCDVGEFR